MTASKPEPKSLTDVLIEQYERRSMTNTLSAINRRGAKKGVNHHNCKYSEDQIKDAKAIHIAFKELGLRTNYVAIAGLTGINILSVKGLFRTNRPTWQHLFPEQWRVDRFKKEANLFVLAKAKYAKAKKQAYVNNYVPKAVTTQVQPTRSTSHNGVNTFFAEVCQLVGREPKSFKSFMVACNMEIRSGRLDRAYFMRNRTSLIQYQHELYPETKPNLNKESIK